MIGEERRYEEKGIREERRGEKDTLSQHTAPSL
jgi:hypothetical protein